MSNVTAGITCPPPFLLAADYINTGGYAKGRLCADVIPGVSCCLPCPTKQWLYSDSFDDDIYISRWLNVPSVILQCFLLLTFILLPEEFTHRHFLSIGLVVSVILFQLAFLIPLGSKPEECYNEATPRDMYSSASCRTTGVLLLGGGMAVAVWIMLRSLWTHLRVCWNFKHPKIFFVISLIAGIGLPGIFLALTLTITGVSYQVGATCFPNNKHAFETWFGWLIAFGSLGAVLQFVTTGFCLWLYLRDYRYGGEVAPETRATGTSEGVAPSETVSGFDNDARANKKLAWRRVRKVLQMQWRSMILTSVVVIMVIYFGTVFVKETRTALQGVAAGDFSGLTDWAICLIANKGDKSKCVRLGIILGLSENSVLASFFMGALVGTFTFALMFRTSMLTGWLRLIRNPKKFLRNASIGEEGFVMMETKRKSFGRPLQSEKNAFDFDVNSYPASPAYPPPSAAPGILPEPVNSRNGSVATAYRKGSTARTTSFPPSSGRRNDSSALGPLGSVPEAGDVSARRENSNLMDQLNQDLDEEDARRVRRVNRRLDDLA